tara:strand:+ start:1040 stop:1213 length:174 start_codon:yes stop_codon:yes gene_type:complete
LGAASELVILMQVSCIRIGSHFLGFYGAFWLKCKELLNSASAAMVSEGAVKVMLKYS